MPNIDLFIKLHNCLETQQLICDEILCQAQEAAEELGFKTFSVSRACTGPASGEFRHCLAAALLDSPVALDVELLVQSSKLKLFR